MFSLEFNPADRVVDPHEPAVVSDELVAPSDMETLGGCAVGGGQAGSRLHHQQPATRSSALLDSHWIEEPEALGVDAKLVESE